MRDPATSCPEQPRERAQHELEVKRAGVRDVPTAPEATGLGEFSRILVKVHDNLFEKCYDPRVLDK